MFTSGCETTPAQGRRFSLAKIPLAARGKLLRSAPRLRRGRVKIAGNYRNAVGEAQARARGAMPLSRAQAAKRALIAALKSLARAYGVPVALSRDADDAAVRAAHRKVVLRVHPDKGGSVADAQRLSAAKSAWDAAKRAARDRPEGGRPGGAERSDRAGWPPRRANEREPKAGERKEGEPKEDAHSARGSAKERTQGGKRGERACAVRAEKSALPLQ